MVDALGYRGDEGRGVTAISLGEVSSNLWSGDFRMGKPVPMINRETSFSEFTPSETRSEPAEVKHLSKRRKIKKLFIPLVAASEKGRAQTLN